MSQENDQRGRVYLTEGENPVIMVAGELDVVTHRETISVLEKARDFCLGKPVEVNLAGATYIDAASFRHFLNLIVEIKRTGGSVRIIAPEAGSAQRMFSTLYTHPGVTPFFHGVEVIYN